MAATPAAAQSLGQVAADEAARRKAIAAPARVLRDTDLRADYPVTTPTEIPPWPDDAAASASAPRQIVEAAAFEAGGMPGIGAMVVAGGEVLLEVTIDAEGQVRGVKALRETPPFTASLVAAVQAWRFAPAEDVVVPMVGQPIDERTRRAATSKVLVVGLFRPPALYAMTLGEPPKTVGAPSDDAPALASPLTMPAYPPNAMFDGSVLLELRLGVDGSVMRRRLMHSSPGLDGPALDAADLLAFRAARVGGRAVPSVAYVVAAFRQPITQ